MFCQKCGNQLPDNANFCAACGAKQQIVENAVPAPEVVQAQPVEQVQQVQQMQEIQKPKKKKPHILITIVVVLCAFLLGKFVIAPSMVSNLEDSDDDTNYQSSFQSENNNEINTPTSSNLSSNVSNGAYEAVFEDSNIVHFEFFFGMDTNNYAKKLDTGVIYCADYGYKNGIVKKWVETVYVPLTGVSNDQKNQLENQFKTQYASLDALNCCSVKYETSANYFTVKITFTDVDKPENYKELFNAKLSNTNSVISMSLTEKNLLDTGLVKK